MLIHNNESTDILGRKAGGMVGHKEGRGQRRKKGKQAVRKEENHSFQIFIELEYKPVTI